MSSEASKLSAVVAVGSRGPAPDSNLDSKTAHPGASVSIESESLQATQWWVALVTVSLPTLLTGVALLLWQERGVHPAAWIAFALMHLATMLGITVGYHRYAAHRAFQCGSWARNALVALGSMAAQGPVVHWVSNHRRHHQFSDEAGDVHSPWQPARGRARGFWHAHVGWMFEPDVTNPVRYSRDLLQDPALMRLNRRYLSLVGLGIVGPAVIVGGLTWSIAAAMDTLFWAGFVRLFTVHHVTWSINSVAHLWGSRRFRSSDHSVNVAWLALPSAGESWHNGHHAFPGSARFGLAWYQVDLGYVLVWSLEKLGLVTRVNRPSLAAMQRARLGAAGSRLDTRRHR